MFVKEYEIPENVKLGRAKAMEVIMLGGVIRLPKKSRIRFWIERHGARIDYYLIYKDKAYHMTYIEFKRRFKVLDKAEELKKAEIPDQEADS